MYFGIESCILAEMLHVTFLLCDILTKLRQGQLKDKLPHNREVRKQILGAVGVDSAFQILLKEQLRMNCM